MKLIALRNFTIIAMGMVLASCGKLETTELQSTLQPDQAVTRISFEFENTKLALTGSPEETPTTETTDVPFQTLQRTSTAIITSFPSVSAVDTIQPTHTATLTPTLQIARTPTHTPTITRTPITPTATLETGWAGEWVVYYASVDHLDQLEQGTMTVKLDGKQLDATAKFGNSTLHLMGMISEDEQNANGEYTQGSESGWFYWEKVSGSQFGGTMGNLFAFCASRKLEDRPDKCYIGVLS